MTGLDLVAVAGAATAVPFMVFLAIAATTAKMPPELVPHEKQVRMGTIGVTLFLAWALATLVLKVLWGAC